jgi:hypothetical protein
VLVTASVHRVSLPHDLGGFSLGRAKCSRDGLSAMNIETLWEDEVQEDLGALTSGAMARIDVGLRAALGIRG